MVVNSNPPDNDKPINPSQVNQDVITQPSKKPTGRPSLYSEELADIILTKLIEGESLRKICLNENMPHVSTVLRWLCKKEHESFRDQYARAREMQADTLADEIIYIADKADKDNAHAQRVKVDARKWVASKLKPKKYSDKLNVGVPDIPEGAEIKVSFVNAKPETSEDALKEALEDKPETESWL